LIILGSLLIFKEVKSNLKEENKSPVTGDFIQPDSTKTITGFKKNEFRNSNKSPENKSNITKNGSKISVIIENDLNPDADREKISNEINLDQITEPVAVSGESGKDMKDNKTHPYPADNNSEILINFAIYPKSGCAPLNVRLENYSRMNGTFEWHFGDGGKSDQKNPVYLFDEAGKYEITLSVFMEDGSVFSATKTIEVFEKPKAAFEIYHESVLNMDQPLVFLNYSNEAEKFLWSFGDGTFSEEISPEHDYKRAGNFDVKLKVWSENGCMDSTVVTNAFQSINGKIEFPTAFIPNLNGPSNGYYTQGLTTNEVFHPDYDGMAEYHLKIYSRSGVLVFESKDVNRGWDGYIKGRLAKQGVYVWKARGRFSNGETFVKFGNVTLIKK
jgi:PKD repeat protein